MSTPIRKFLRDDSLLQNNVEDGVQAVETAHRDYIEANIRNEFSDSLNIDEAFRQTNPQDNRWDYLLGHSNSKRVFGLEPHSANNKEVKVLIGKRLSCIQQMRKHLKSGAHVSKWFWVASGEVELMPLDKKRFELDRNGIQFVGKKLLKKHLT